VLDGIAGGGGGGAGGLQAALSPSRALASSAVTDVHLCIVLASTCIS
jgi:hypothetical protein